MADIKPRFTKGQRTIVNYKIPGPIRESAHDSQPYHPDPYNPPNRPPYAILPSHQTTLIPTSPPPLPHLTINPPLEGELDHPSGGCIYVPFLLLLLLLLSDTLDSRPYTGIDYGFTLVYGNHRMIHNPSRESTLDSQPYMGIDIGFTTTNLNQL